MQHPRLRLLILSLVIVLPLPGGAGEPRPEIVATASSIDAKMSKSDQPLTLGNRARSKANAGDFAGAVANTSLQIAIRPHDGSLYSARAGYEQLNGSPMDAIADYRKCLDLAIDPKYQVEERFQLWICESEVGMKSVANHSLSLYLKSLGSPWGDWMKKIGTFLLGRISEADFLASAEGPDKVISAERLSQAQYYVGIMRLLNGDRAGALDFFRQSLAMPNHSIEYFMASGELKRKEL